MWHFGRERKGEGMMSRSMIRGLLLIAVLATATACGDDGTAVDGAVSGSTTSVGAFPCIRESANGGQLVAVVGRAGTAYNGELLAPEGEFESASSPVSPTPIKRREDAVAMLRALRSKDPVLAADGGVQSSAGPPSTTNGHAVVEVTSKYGTNGRVVTAVDCGTGLVRKVTWESFG